MVILLAAVLRTARWLVIGPEERYLSTAFPEAYPAYQARMRRWL